MIKIEFEGEIYYFNKGKLYDDSYLEVPQSISKKVVTHYYNNLNYNEFDEEKFLEYLKNLKASELYSKCISAVEYAFKKFSYSEELCKIILPIATSCYRLQGEPKQAISFWEERKTTFYSCVSSALFTSLAAAYCDIEDYDNAKKNADRACALSGGPQKMAQELIGVYSRIKAETSSK